jgi:thiamine pyrophosphokinase
VLGALAGERLDHELANLLLLADAQFTGRQVRIVRGETLVRALSGGNALRIEAQRGDTVTLLPIGGPAVGVTTEGLRYPLDGETLPVGSSLGLSNEVVRDGASVRLGEGSLLVIEIGRTTKGAR